MPTYSYACPKCGHEYEKLQKISDSTRAKCPECGARGERLITGGAGLVFKGSGFYITDYKRAGEKKDADAASTEQKADAKKADAKADVKSPSSKPSSSSEKKGAES